MKFVLIFGPSAVGKMTVGQELAALTHLRLFHNHMSIEFVLPFFDFGHPSFKYLNNLIRREVFQEVAKSDLPGLIFTFVWAMDYPEEDEYVDEITQLFESQGATIFYVELLADQAIRAERNRHPHRLSHKPSKQRSNADDVFWHHENKYRLNTHPGEFKRPNYLRLRTDDKSAYETAISIKTHFGW